MTSNHLLLYHLAELMLENEQHILPVDLLFDDEQIGDFVKSIQIDSPYQQLLLEGVLTESVRDEKLYVSFTVEGYFHYLLGDVIYNRTEDLGAEALKQIIEENKLNGAKEGVEQCLIRDVQKDDLTRLMWLIDNEDYNIVDICYAPLAHSLFIQNVTSKSEEELYNAHRNKIEFVVEELFADFSENDVRVLEKSIDYLYNQQKHLIVAIIHSILNEVLKPYGIRQAILSLNGISYLSPEFRLEKLKKIQKLKFRGEQPQKIEFYFSLANEYRDISKYDDALKIYRKAYRIIQSLADSDMFSLIDYYNYVGIILTKKGDYSKAIIYFNKAVKILTSLSVKNIPMFSTCYNNLGTTWDYFGNHKKAINFLEKSLKYRLEYFGRNHPKTATIYNNLGGAYTNISKYKMALSLYEEALKIRIELFGENHESTDESMNSIGLSYIFERKLSNAIEYFEKSLKIRKNIHGKYHPSTLLMYNEIIATLLKLDQIEKAEEYFEELNIHYTHINTNHSIETTEIKSKILLAKGDFVNAIRCLESCLALYLNEPNSRKNKIKIASLYMDIGDTWSREGDYNKAIENFERALKYGLNLKNEDGTDIGLSLTYESIGSAFEQIGDSGKALHYFKKALEINLKVHGEVHISTSTNYMNLASLYESKNDFENALTYYEKCLEIDLLTFGNENHYTRDSYFFVGRISRKANNHIRAINAFNNALRIDLHHHRFEHEDTLSDYKMIAKCWLSECNIIKASENLKKALEISILLNGKSHPETVKIDKEVKLLKIK